MPADWGSSEGTTPSSSLPGRSLPGTTSNPGRHVRDFRVAYLVTLPDLLSLERLPHESLVLAISFRLYFSTSFFFFIFFYLQAIEIKLGLGFRNFLTALTIYTLLKHTLNT
jgi:hypothetical protein